MEGHDGRIALQEFVDFIQRKASEKPFWSNGNWHRICVVGLVADCKEIYDLCGILRSHCFKCLLHASAFARLDSQSVHARENPPTLVDIQSATTDALVADAVPNQKTKAEESLRTHGIATLVVEAKDFDHERHTMNDDHSDSGPEWGGGEAAGPERTAGVRIVVHPTHRPRSGLEDSKREWPTFWLGDTMHVIEHGLMRHTLNKGLGRTKEKGESKSR